MRDQPRPEIAAEKAGRVFLDQQRVGLAEIEARIDLPAVAVGRQRDQAFLLGGPDAGVLEVAIFVAHGREEDRRIAPVRRLQQRDRRCDLRVEIGAEHGVLVGERLGQVDDDQRGALPEPDPQAKPALRKKFGVARPVLVRHGGPSSCRCFRLRRASLISRFCFARPIVIKPPIFGNGPLSSAPAVGSRGAAAPLRQGRRLQCKSGLSARARWGRRSAAA